MSTTQNYAEQIKQVFPAIKEAQIVKDLDIAQTKFASETGLLETRGQLSSISTNFAWNLPSDFDRLTDFVMYDSSGNPLYIGDYDYAYGIEFGKFYIKSLTSTEITGLDSGIDSAYIHYKQLPTALASRATAMEVEKMFRDAVEHDVLSKYFAKYPTTMFVRGEQMQGRDLSSASYHEKRYERLKIKAKRYAGMKTPPGSAQIYQHAGAFALPRRPNDSAQGSTTTTQVTALTDLYAKWVLYNIATGASGAQSPATTAIGYTTITCSVSGLTMTVSSTGEFGNDTMILCNDYLVGWTQDSDSQITFTLPGSFTLVSIEIYERI